MSSLAVFNKNMVYINKFDYNKYIGFRYHRLLFRSLIFKGNKLWAFSFINELKYQIKIKEKKDPYFFILIALVKIAPYIFAYPIKLGGVIKKLPVFIKERKQYTLVIKWTVKLLRKKWKRITIRHLAKVLFASFLGEGAAIEQKVLAYESCIMNRHLLKFFKFK